MDLDRAANELTIEDFDSQGRLKVVKLNAKALNDGVEKFFSELLATRCCSMRDCPRDSA